MSLPYEKKNIPLAKNLRKRMTKWEQRLWYDFLVKNPVRFQRQKPIGSYIADFYCHDATLVIELDGRQHRQDEEISANDLIRQETLEKMGLTILRFSNEQVEKNFSKVCDSINRTVMARISVNLKEKNDN